MCALDWGEWGSAQLRLSLSGVPGKRGQESLHPQVHASSSVP